MKVLEVASESRCTFKRYDPFPCWQSLNAVVSLGLITVLNGTEFHGCKEVEEKTGAEIYFANPHHAWERGSNENANGLIRQYLPKGVNLTRLTQRNCNLIAEKLNNRPRKRLGFKTPKECFYEN